MKTTPRAFTLIELLTVIAIIGILAGILIPVTLRVRESAWAARGVQQKRQIALALAVYATENKNYYPPISRTVGSDTFEWYGALAPYLPMPLNSAGADKGTHHPIFADPKARSDVKVRRSYAAGGVLHIPNGNSASTNWGSRLYYGRRLDTIETPKSGVLFFDAMVSNSTGKCSTGAKWADFKTDLDQQEGNTIIDYRYNDSAQFAFADYHVEALTPQKARDKFTNFRAYEGR